MHWRPYATARTRWRLAIPPHGSASAEDSPGAVTEDLLPLAPISPILKGAPLWYPCCVGNGLFVTYLHA